MDDITLAPVTMQDLIADFGDRSFHDVLLRRGVQWLVRALHASGPVLYGRSVWSSDGKGYTRDAGPAMRRFAAQVTPDGYHIDLMELIPPESELSVALGVPRSCDVMIPREGR